MVLQAAEKSALITIPCCFQAFLIVNFLNTYLIIWIVLYEACSIDGNGNIF
jgi:hypothetical protein